MLIIKAEQIEKTQMVFDTLNNPLELIKFEGKHEVLNNVILELK